MSSKLSGLTATTSLVDADLLYVAKSPFSTSDSKKITVANLKTSLFNSPLSTTGDAGTYDKYAFIKTSPSTVNQGGLIFSNVYANTGGYNGFKMTSTYNSTTATSVFSMGFVELNATETFTTNSNGFLNFYNNSGAGYINAHVPFISVSSIASIYSTVNSISDTSTTTFTTALGNAGNLVTAPYVGNGFTALATFANTDDNSTKPKVVILARTTAAGSLIYFGTSNGYASGVTQLGVNIDQYGKLSCFASSTSSASLRINSGVAPTTPADGDMWYDGTNVKFRVGATTKTFTLV